MSLAVSASVVENWTSSRATVATLVFVEVKARAGREFGDAAEAVTPLKQLRMTKLATEYLMRHHLSGLPVPFRRRLDSLRRRRAGDRDHSERLRCLSCRKDPITGRWVVVSTERQKRPNDFTLHRADVIGREHCPFCPGREGMTPPEVLAYRHNGSAPNGPGWDLRVVPNKFPALRVEGTLDREGEGMFDRMSGIGAHEVVIETTDHDKTFATMCGAGDRARAVGVPRPRARPQERHPFPLHPPVQEPRRRRPARRSSTATAS